MKRNNFKIVKIDKSKSLFNYEKKILINELILDLKLGYYDFEKEKSQKVKFSLEVDYRDKKPSNDKDLKSIVNYAKIVKLIKKLVKNKHYNFLETLAEDVFDELFPINRSIMGEGYRHSLKILNRLMPTKNIEFNSGKNIFDWKAVPLRSVIPQLPEFATVRSSALPSPSVVVPKSNRPELSIRSLSVYADPVHLENANDPSVFAAIN